MHQGTRRTIRRPALPLQRIVVATVLVLVAAACGGGDDQDAATTATTAETSDPAPDPSEPDANESEDAPTEEPTSEGSESAIETAPPESESESAEPVPQPEPEDVPLGVTSLRAPISTEDFEASGEDDLAAWQAAVPEIQDVRITSSADGSEQPALWLPPSGDDQPLLVVLHSWSSPYVQQLNIPYATWARENGWGMVVPEFRGVNERPESTASDLAVADVLDAVDYALEEGGGNEERVFTIGFSGGGMMSLVMAGRAPERFAGTVAWVPIYDLRDWYAVKTQVDPPQEYVAQIEASCGGPPVPGTPAADECLSRSPAAVLEAAREAGVPVYIGAGLSDDNVPPSAAVRSFNALAEEAARFDEPAAAAFGAGTLPGEGLVDADVDIFFGPEQPEAVVARQSGSATLVVFEGVHEMLYDPGLQWMAAQG